MKYTKIINGKRLQMSEKEINDFLTNQPIKDEILKNAINNKIYQIKQEAERQILAIYPLYKQNNILMSQDNDAIMIMNDDILKLRNKSNEIEKSLEGKTIEELEAFDVSDNNLWQ